MLAPPAPLYKSDLASPLADLRGLVGEFPEAVHADVRVLAALLGCSEAEAEEARRWLVEDGLEVLA